jgi:hypothetical protein
MKHKTKKKEIIISLNRNKKDSATPSVYKKLKPYKKADTDYNRKIRNILLTLGVVSATGLAVYLNRKNKVTPNSGTPNPGVDQKTGKLNRKQIGWIDQKTGKLTKLNK